ncbi:MAG: AAA family ATPase [Promethearchaeota archaeon]
MPKKALGHKVSHFSVGDEKDPVVVDSNKINIEELDFTTDSNEIEFIQKIIIKPAGYPIKPFDAPETIQITINKDPKLFQAYATEQWQGLAVQINDYIFDQLLLPDFAFKITKIEPDTAYRIGSETEFTLIQDSTPTPIYAEVSFDEIIGNMQAKEKAEIVIEYLKDPTRFGEWAPKNILFHGPPGTGKTLMARAIATSSNCAFFAKKGTTLIGLHVGDGASKIHALFAKARKFSPAIIFIDELDSIGLNRSYQSVRGDVIEVTTALLAELDGLDPNEGIITIAATNKIQLLDVGLRNRFEEEIYFPNPTESEREAMLRLFSQKTPIPMEVDFAKIAQITPDWSGRGLHEKLMKIAIHRGIREKLTLITTDIFIDLVKKSEKTGKNNQPPQNFFT